MQEIATIQIFVVIPVTKEAQQRFMQVMRANAIASRCEPGNISFEVFRGEDGGPAIYLFARWRDKSAYDEHMQSKHFKGVEDVLPATTDGNMTLVWLEEVPEVPAEVANDEVVAPRNVIVFFDTSDETRNAFLEAIGKVVPNARAARGNFGFNLFQVRDKRNRFLVAERWASVGDHEAHLEANYCRQFGETVQGLLTANPMDNRWLLTEVDFRPR